MHNMSLLESVSGVYEMLWPMIYVIGTFSWFLEVCHVYLCIYLFIYYMFYLVQKHIYVSTVSFLILHVLPKKTNEKIYKKEKKRKVDQKVSQTHAILHLPPFHSATSYLLMLRPNGQFQNMALWLALEMQRCVALTAFVNSCSVRQAAWLTDNWTRSGDKSLFIHVVL